MFDSNIFGIRTGGCLGKWQEKKREIGCEARNSGREDGVSARVAGKFE